MIIRKTDGSYDRNAQEGEEAVVRRQHDRLNIRLEYSGGVFQVKLGSAGDVILWKAVMSGAMSLLEYLPDGHFEARIGVSRELFESIRVQWSDRKLERSLAVEEFEAIRAAMEEIRDLESPDEFAIVYGASRDKLVEAVDFIRSFRAALVYSGF
ncbi:hypothetical protein [Streptomyces vinaceus]|uniref:hypothetical protein n=1 Tax=Streptomyces vinaceus TaxID=1960 RepID=UPI003807FBE9